ncbi:MAG: VIT1/CCC1 transporter family protein [Thermoplasmata archaeon]|nr:VIT1/CCC1 transporter family protein [Thermoplasmata archaeon]
MSLRTKARESHPRPGLLSDFILGSQDGLVNVLGILLGLSAATNDLRLILIAAFAALGAETISMGAVAYTSTMARRRLYTSEIARERQEMSETPEAERVEVRTVLSGWGYVGAQLDEMTERICENPKAWLEFMMAFELKLAPVDANQARDSAFVVGAATLVGSIIPLLPYLVPGIAIDSALVVSVVLSGITLAGIGLYEAHITDGKPFQSAGQMMLIGLTAGFAGFLIGHFLGAP